MLLTVNKADNGDCILLQTENTSILIDGGTAKSFDDWKKALEGTPNIDALFITHIDNDHVNGIIRMLNSIEEHKDLPRPMKVYFNGIKQIMGGIDPIVASDDSDIEMSAVIANYEKATTAFEDIDFSQATALSFLLQQYGYEINPETQGQVLHKNNCSKLKIGDLSLEIIGPDESSTIKLKREWSRILRENSIKSKSISKVQAQAFEIYLSTNDTSRNDEISNRSIVSFNALAESKFTKDTSIPNETSISFLAEGDNKSILLLGDAHSETILSWLDNKKVDKLKVNAVKLPHHGSKHNYCEEMARRIISSNYFVSTNGAVFYHPDIEVFARIVKFSQTPEINFYFNYDIPDWLTEQFMEESRKHKNIRYITLNETFEL